MIEYYSRPFLNFHLEIKDRIKPGTFFIRDSFWDSISEGAYHEDEASHLIKNYQKYLENKAKKIVEKYSIAYWLHLSRRISPSTSGFDKRPETIYLSRLNLDIAVQKFASVNLCKHIALSKETDLEKVFNGLLLEKEYGIEKQLINVSPNMLILTDFNEENLFEYYELEKICYEIWVCGAKLRSISKGAHIKVDHKSENKFIEIRSAELNWLIESFDNRSGGFISSATGTVFTNSSLDKNSRSLIPILNTFSEDLSSYIQKLGELFNIKLVGPLDPNFILLPIPLKKYSESHTPFKESFVKKYGLNYQSIIYFLSALVNRYFFISMEENQGYIFHLIKRGYEGPMEKEVIVKYVIQYLPAVEGIFEKEINLNEKEIVRVFDFLKLDNQENLKFLYPGTVKMILPVNKNMYYLDYSKVPVILENLFYGLDLNKQSFRGETLEEAISNKDPYLPTYPLKAFDNTKKQIDYSLKIGNILIIVECKVVAKASSMYAGSAQSIQYRNEHVVERALREVDEKAKWLQINPNGRNYNTNGVKYILPIAVSPFSEFIPRKEKYYWVKKGIPRILTPEELNTLTSNKLKSTDLFNLFELHQ